jgi:hypothetical protein
MRSLSNPPRQQLALENQLFWEVIIEAEVEVGFGE